MIKINAIMLFLLSSVLLGCSVEGKNDFGSYYQKQASLDLLKMPPGVSAQGVDNYYTVPPGPMADVKTVSILPPGSRAFESVLAKQQPQSADKPRPANESKPVDASKPTDAPKPTDEPQSGNEPQPIASTTGNS